MSSPIPINCNNFKFSLILAWLFAVLAGCEKTPSKTHSFPEEMQYFTDSKRVEVTFSQPVTRRQDGFQIVRFVKLKSGETVVPMFAVGRPKYGTTGVGSQKAWEPILWALVKDQAYVFLPLGDEIDAYIFLVRPIESDDRSWRIWELPSTIVEGDKPDIQLPIFADLEPLKLVQDGGELERKFQVGSKYSETLGTWVDD